MLAAGATSPWFFELAVFETRSVASMPSTTTRKDQYHCICHFWSNYYCVSFYPVGVCGLPVIYYSRCNLVSWVPWRARLWAVLLFNEPKYDLILWGTDSGILSMMLRFDSYSLWTLVHRKTWFHNALACSVGDIFDGWVTRITFHSSRHSYHRWSMFPADSWRLWSTASPYLFFDVSPSLTWAIQACTSPAKNDSFMICHTHETGTSCTPLVSHPNWHTGRPGKSLWKLGLTGRPLWTLFGLGDVWAILGRFERRHHYTRTAYQREGIPTVELLPEVIIHGVNNWKLFLAWAPTSHENQLVIHNRSSLVLYRSIIVAFTSIAALWRSLIMGWIHTSPSMIWTIANSSYRPSSFSRCEIVLVFSGRLFSLQTFASWIQRLESESEPSSCISTALLSSI